MNSASRLLAGARAFAALCFILCLACGVPIVLLALIGNPVPTSLGLQSQLTSTQLLQLLACIAWLLWAQMTACLAFEIISEFRQLAGRPVRWARRLPGTFAAQQALARGLVQAVTLVGLSAAAATAASDVDVHSGLIASSTLLDTSQPTQHAEPVDRSRQVAGTTEDLATVEVQRGDSLWSIAEKHLGSGERWREIAQLNQGRQMDDGRRFEDVRTIMPGWRLRIPSQRSSTTTVVQPGDTLWGIAQRAYGDGTEWPRIANANPAQVTQPDLLRPGQRLTLPRPRQGDPIRNDARRSTAPHESGSNTPHGSTPQRAHHHATVDGLTQLPSPTSPAPTGPSSGGEGHVSRDGTSSLEPSRPDRSPTWPWLLGGGTFLAAGLAAGLLSRRKAQFRSRTSGRTIARTRSVLRPLEGAVRASGSAGLESAAFVDHSLRELSQRCLAEGLSVPEVRAACLDEESFELHLAVPNDELPTPWVRRAEGRIWCVPRSYVPAESEGVAPYPALVALGADEVGRNWMVDLEALGVLTIGGNSEIARGVARFVTAELAVNAWAEPIDVAVSGVGEDLVILNPERLHAEAEPDFARLTKALRLINEALRQAGRSVLDQRAEGASADTWTSTVLVADLAADPGAGDSLDELVGALRTLDQRAAVALVATGTPSESSSFKVRDDGRLLTPWGELRPNLISTEEADKLAQLFSDHDADAAEDEPMPHQPTVDARPAEMDAAGALLREHTSDRDGLEDAASLLPRPDADYVATAATTCNDLQALAPHVPDHVRAAATVRDPGLDEELRAWADPTCPRPKLRLLGPVELTSLNASTGDVERRPAYFAEIAAFLATHPEGATPGQMADAFNLQNNSLHSRMNSLRKWWGTAPDSGEPYLPPAHLTPAGKSRGLPVYQAPGLLFDADLFRRLRARGEALGSGGIVDLEAALDLVTGAPFDQLRPGGYGWLSETPADHYLTAGVVDVAHVLATHWLAEGDPKRAMRAAERAIQAAPYEDKPRLDYVRAIEASGDAQTARRYLAEQVDNRSDDTGPPPQRPERTQQLRRAER